MNGAKRAQRASGKPRHLWLARAFSPELSSSTSHHMSAKI
jgi:hypothetical protein